MEDTYFFIGNVMNSNNGVCTLLLHDGTIIKNVNLEIIFGQDIKLEEVSVW